MLVRAAKDLGITRMVVTHAMMPPIKMTVEQMKQAAAMGAYIEFVYNGTIGPKHAYELSDYAAAIRAVGPEHCILSSDLGQVGNPLHPDGLEAYFKGLRALGFSDADMDRISKTNPARVLGLE